MKRLFLIATLLTCSVSYGQECISGDCTNGFGTMQFAYEDPFVQSGFMKKHKKVYVGEFKNGLPHGKGKRRGCKRERNSEGLFLEQFSCEYETDESWLNIVSENDVRNNQLSDIDIIHRRYTEKELEQFRELDPCFRLNVSYACYQSEVDMKIKEKAEEKREKEEAKKSWAKYNKIYDACLLDKSSGIDMQMRRLRRIVEDTCKSIAKDPSWLENLRYN